MEKALDRTFHHRSPAEVLDYHLRESEEGSIEADLSRNYSEDLVVLTGSGAFLGHGGLPHLAERQPRSRRSFADDQLRAAFEEAGFPPNSPR